MFLSSTEVPFCSETCTRQGCVCSHLLLRIPDPVNLFTPATLTSANMGQLYLNSRVDYEQIRSYTISVRVQNDLDGVPEACPQISRGKGAHV